jgi:hypothetical protein
MTSRPVSFAVNAFRSGCWTVPKRRKARVEGPGVIWSLSTAPCSHARGKISPSMHGAKLPERRQGEVESQMLILSPRQVCAVVLRDPRWRQ